MRLFPSVAPLSFVAAALAHSWVENVQELDADDGPIGSLGYIRNFTARLPGSRPDDGNTHRLISLAPEQRFCGPFHDSSTQSEGFPRLQARPGARIAAQYLENGHISAPLAPRSVSGSITWLGVERDVSQEDNTTLGDVQHWRCSHRDRVLAASEFDDGVCGRGDLARPCRSVFQIPADASPGAVLSVYWLWDYSGKLGPDTGHVELYTSCLDIDVVNG